MELLVDRVRCERLWQPLLERIRQPIARALRDCEVQPDKLDEVLLVGGATRMPCFVELAAKMFGRMPNRHLPADEAVAMGAAIQAALKQRDAAVDDLVVTDIAPFSLGIAQAARHGQRYVEGIFAPIIERGTVIPVSRSETFHTIEDFQTVIRVEVYQGEHSLCRDNTKLGELEVTGLERKPAGDSGVEVRFTYDLNGILDVEATVLGSQKKHSLLIQQRPGVLSGSQLKAAREAMQKLKFHPRAALPNQTALARADALYVELRGEQREELGRVIAALRAALDTQVRAEYEPVRERLVQLTEALRRCPRP